MGSLPFADCKTVDGRRPIRLGADLLLPKELGRHREPEAVATGYLLVYLVHPSLGLGDEVALAGGGIRAHAVAEQLPHVSGRQVGGDSPVGEYVAVILEREAVGAGTEPRVGNDADLGRRRG